MKKITSVHQLSASISQLKELNSTVGFVPTMGALHQGHLALVEQSNKENQHTIVSIFVNPLQFNKVEDLKKYPRTLEADVHLLHQSKCDILFYPKKENIYEGYNLQAFNFGKLEQVMEAVNRPGHFNGVANIVNRLFELIKPDRAYFGEKDFQQIAIVKHMSRTLHPKIKIVPCKTVRNKDGLALSSRNVRINDVELKKSATLYQSLQYCRHYKNQYNPQELIANAITLIDEKFTLEYFIIADEDTLQPINSWEDSANPRAFVVAEISGVRLIDNLSLNSF